MEKKVSRLGLVTLSIGGMVGWGAFMQPGLTFIPKAGVLSTMIAMLIGVVMVSTIATCYGIILNKMPDANGGEYSYSKLAFSERHTFVVGWFLLIVFIGIVALNATSFALVFKDVLYPNANFIELYQVAGAPVTLGEAIITILVIFVFSWFMIKGVKAVVHIQNVVTVALIIIVSLIFFLGLRQMDFSAAPLGVHFRQNQISFSEIITILVITPWAYYGVSNIPKVANEAELPYKEVVFLTILSLVCGFIIYQMLLILTASSFSRADLNGYYGWATGQAIKNLFGKAGVFMVTMGLAFAIFSGINSFFMGATRVMNSMSEDGLLPARFSVKHKKYGTPYQSIVFILIVIMITPFFGRKVMGWIVDMSALGGAIIFFYTACTAFKISQGIERIIGFVAIIFSSIFILLLVVPISPGFLAYESIIALVVWVVLGVILYKMKKNK